MQQNDQKKKGFSSLGDILPDHAVKEENRFISREFQDFGLQLAEELDDMKHKALYIKLAKEHPRGKLEAAKSFVMDAPNVKNKGALFMWKLKNQKK